TVPTTPSTSRTYAISQSGTFGVLLRIAPITHNAGTTINASSTMYCNKSISFHHLFNSDLFGPRLHGFLNVSKQIGCVAPGTNLFAINNHAMQNIILAANLFVRLWLGGLRFRFLSETQGTSNSM